MGIVEVLAIVFGLAGYTSLVHKANDSGLDWHCVEYSERKRRSTLRHIIPWPMRKGSWTPVIGATNKCTGEVWNGRWWYKPEAVR